MRFSLSSLTPPQRARVAVGALLLIACGNLYLVQDVAQLWQPAADAGGDPQDYLDRLAALRRRLPPDARIEYRNPTLQNDSARKRDLFLTRYALVPRCVGSGTDAALLLVWGATAEASGAGAHATLLDDLKNGFRLYQRDAPP